MSGENIVVVQGQNEQTAKAASEAPMSEAKYKKALKRLARLEKVKN